MDSHFIEWKEWGLLLVLEERNEILIYVISPRHTHVLSVVEYPSAEKNQ